MYRRVIQRSTTNVRMGMVPASSSTIVRSGRSRSFQASIAAVTR